MFVYSYLIMIRRKRKHFIQIFNFEKRISSQENLEIFQNMMLNNNKKSSRELVKQEELKHKSQFYEESFKNIHFNKYIQQIN